MHLLVSQANTRDGFIADKEESQVRVSYIYENFKFTNFYPSQPEMMSAGTVIDFNEMAIPCFSTIELQIVETDIVFDDMSEVVSIDCTADPQIIIKQLS